MSSNECLNNVQLAAAAGPLVRPMPLALVKLIYQCNPCLPTGPVALALREAIRGAPIAHTINHKAEALAFAQAFFAKNIIKCYLALEASRVNLRSYRRISDLGCGPGTFSFAFAYMAADNQMRFELTDRSAEQLSLARRLLKGARLPGVFLFERADLETATPHSNSLNIASYLFCEMLRDADVVRLIERLVAREALIVDYDTVIEQIVCRLPSSFQVKRRWSRRVASPAGLRQTLGESFVQSHGIHIVRKRPACQVFHSLGTI